MSDAIKSRCHDDGVRTHDTLTDKALWKKPNRTFRSCIPNVFFLGSRLKPTATSHGFESVCHLLVRGGCSNQESKLTIPTPTNHGRAGKVCSNREKIIFFLCTPSQSTTDHDRKPDSGGSSAVLAVRGTSSGAGSARGGGDPTPLRSQYGVVGGGCNPPIYPILGTEFLGKGVRA